MAMTCRSGKGKELFEILKKALHLPDQATHVNIEIDIDGVYFVSVDYLPVDNVDDDSTL